MSKIFAVCDTDRLYVKNLIQYINSRQNIPLKLQAFTSTELLKEYAVQNSIELLLISTEAMDEEIAELSIGKIVLLTEDGAVGVKGFPTVNRYQASGNLVQEVMQYYGTGNLAVAYAAAKLATTQIIGIYSPIKRCGKTTFALALGEEYAKNKHVLYINLEDFSGFRALFNREYRMDVSDLLYFYREEKQGMLNRVEEIAERLHFLYYLPPAMCPADMKSVQPEEWREWFLLLMQSKYEVIIVEPGECIYGLEEILALCNKIYMPILEDKISLAKLKEYEDYLLLSGWEALNNKIQRQPMVVDREEKGILEYMESEAMRRIIEKIRKEVLNRLDQTRELADEEIWRCIDEVVVQFSKREYLPLPKRSQVRKGVFDSLRRLDILQELLEDDEITEIMVNGCEDIFVERQGSIEKLDRHFISQERLSDVIQLMVAKVNRRVNEASPIVDSRLEDGSRVNVVLNPVAINGPIITIRKFPKNPITMEMLVLWETISEEAAAMLKDMVAAGYNIMVCGGTGSGKTTFLNAMSDFIPKEERIITVEDSAELQIKGVANLVKLETRNGTTEGEHSISIRDLIRTSLRMRPDRIIVGEVRGEEAVDLLQSMNTGHDGAMSSGHSNSPLDMLRRLETMVLMGLDMPIQAIRGQITSALDIVIHLGRMRDKSRRVLEIAEVLPLKNNNYQLNRIFWFEETAQKEGGVVGRLSGGRERLKNRQKLIMAGINWETPGTA